VKPESTHQVEARVNSESLVATAKDCAMDRSYKQILKNVPPFMLINVLGYDFPAFLDTGSPLSF